MIFIPEFIKTLSARLKEESPLVQVILGPRQVGKTTAVMKLISELNHPTHYVSADKTLPTPVSWLIENWQTAKAKSSNCIFFIDEIQKIPNWSETVKKFWDAEDKASRLKLVLLGSSSLEIQDGLTESLTGRFELIRAYHWNWPECQRVFGWSLDQFLIYGGYPGAAEFIHDYPRWYSYIKESVIDTVVGKDILLHKKVSNPALFRQAFDVLSSYPAQDISYNKVIGQLQTKGNTDLVKRYIDIYAGAFLINAIHKYGSNLFKTKTSSPKIIPLSPSLSSIQFGPDALKNATIRGRLFELAVGSDLSRLPGKLYYWRDGNFEVDFIYEYQNKTFAIEVKSSRLRKFDGLKLFLDKFPDSILVIVSEKNYYDFASDPLKFLFALNE